MVLLTALSNDGFSYHCVMSAVVDLWYQTIVEHAKLWEPPIELTDHPQPNLCSEVSFLWARGFQRTSISIIWEMCKTSYSWSLLQI